MPSRGPNSARPYKQRGFCDELTCEGDTLALATADAPRAGDSMDVADALMPDAIQVKHVQDLIDASLALGLRQRLGQAPRREPEQRLFHGQ